MHRILLACVAVSAFMSCLSTTAALASAGTPSLPAQKEVEVNPHALREMLVKGLKVTRSDEEKYIDQVVKAVVEGKLPVAIVYASFRYARTRRPDYPYPYFVFSLETLAKKQQKQQ